MVAQDNTDEVAGETSEAAKLQAWLPAADIREWA